MLFLFSDVGERDAPTRIRIGSHADIARQLARAGEEGLTLGNCLLMDSLGARTARSSPPPAMREQCTCAIRSSCTLRSRTRESARDSWLSRRCCPWIRTTGQPGNLNPVEQATARALGRAL